jgi:hypothetical protein
LVRFLWTSKENEHKKIKLKIDTIKPWYKLPDNHLILFKKEHLKAWNLNQSISGNLRSLKKIAYIRSIPLKPKLLPLIAMQTNLNQSHHEKNYLIAHPGNIVLLFPNQFGDHHSPKHSSSIQFKRSLGYGLWPRRMDLVYRIIGQCQKDEPEYLRNKTGFCNP